MTLVGGITYPLIYSEMIYLVLYFLSGLAGIKAIPDRPTS